MCVIILAHDKFPEEEFLQACNAKNSDGAGIAWIEGGAVKYSKGDLTADDINNFKFFTKPPYLIHFRKATQGGNKPELAHPFPVGLVHGDELEGEANAVIAHNGTWDESKWRHFLVKSIKEDEESKELLMPKGPWSDSKVIAYLYSIHGNTFLEYLNEKVAVLTPKGLIWYGPQGTENGWNKEGDFYVSNLVWKKNSQDPLCIGGC